MILVAALALAILGAQVSDWEGRWQQNITAEAGRRYCDTETGEELGWLVSPFLEGFAWGYEATKDPIWIDRLVDWTDSWLKRGLKEPDGFVGWPKQGTGGSFEDELDTDSLLGEAMAFRPVIRLSALILKTPGLRAIYETKAKEYIATAERDFQKWDSRGCWRTVKDGGLWVVPMFGIDTKTGGWTSGYDSRRTDGFSNPDNKENAIAEWLLTLYDATGKRIYRDRAEAWFKLMKSRIRTQSNRALVWNYWDPAGPWDFKADGSTKHWVGVHPNGGYYGIDVAAIVDAYGHHLVFTKADIDALIKTNRDFMWNQKVEHAEFRRMDGGAPDSRWPKSPGILWTALIPYDETLRKVFEANFDPTGWGALSTAPWFLAMTHL